MHRSIRTATTGAGAIAAVLGLAMPVSAASDLTITVGGVHWAAPGTIVLLRSQSVPADLRGASCTGRLTGTNNESVHPGTDLIVTSDGSTMTMSDVEAAAGAVETTSGPITLGPTVDVSLRIGSDGLASLSAVLELDCAASEAPTPTEAPTTSATTTTTTTTTLAPTTTESTTMAPAVSEVTTTAGEALAGGPTPSNDAPSAPAQVASGGPLPATGPTPQTPAIVAIGAGAIVAGLLTRRAARR